MHGGQIERQIPYGIKTAFPLFESDTASVSLGHVAVVDSLFLLLMLTG